MKRFTVLLVSLLTLTFARFSQPTSAVSSAFGIAGEDILSASDQDARLSDMQSLGMHWLRVDMDWTYVQTSQITYNWAQYDKLASAAKAHNIRLLFILIGTVSWARTGGCSGTEYCVPDTIKFASFAQKVVQRYASQGVHAYEVWNEPNLPRTWASHPSVTQYVSLLKGVYPVIKQADPLAVVVSGGLSPLATYAPASEGIPATTFVSGLYQRGAKSYFTALGFHPYGYPTAPNEYEPWNGFSILTATTLSIRSIMTANGDSAKQVWLTEFGAPTNGPGAIATCTNSNYDNGPDHVDECLQARMMTQAIQLVKGYTWAGPLFIYTYTDFSSTDTSTNENFFGLIRYNKTHKPAYDTVKQAIAL